MNINYLKNIITGSFGSAILLVVWFFIDPIEDHDMNMCFLLFVVFSLLLYPFSRFFILKIASLFLKDETWKALIGDDISTPKLEALFSFCCMMVAIPVGGCCLMFFLIKRWL